MTAPRTQLRAAACAALAAAASLYPADPDFSPLLGAQICLGQTWPSQSPAPGAGALPAQLLVYGWEQKSENRDGGATAPQFTSTLTLVIETRVETKALAPNTNLPAQPSGDAIAAAIDGQVDALAFAVVKAVCQFLRAVAPAVGAVDVSGYPFVEQIGAIGQSNKYDDSGQRVLGQGVVTFDLVFTETFEPLIGTSLDTINTLIAAESGATANEGNTGNGQIASVTAGLGAMGGAYAIMLTSSTAFTVTDPNGAAVGAGGTVGAPFSAGGIGFKVLAGPTPFVAGDGFTLTVQAQGSYQLGL